MLIESPDPWLQKTVHPFDFNLYDARSIANEMLKIMNDNDGLGLSANQVGLDAQIFVQRPLLLEDKTPLVVINPTILKVSEEREAMPEGCLSHPMLFLNVARPKSLVAKYIDITQEERIIELVDIDARCFLHEFDHLHGIEFTDRVSKLKLDRARAKRQKIKKRTVHG